MPPTLNSPPHSAKQMAKTSKDHIITRASRMPMHWPLHERSAIHNWQQSQGMNCGVDVGFITEEILQRQPNARSMTGRPVRGLQDVGPSGDAMRCQSQDAIHLRSMAPASLLAGWQSKDAKESRTTTLPGAGMSTPSRKKNKKNKKTKKKKQNHMNKQQKKRGTRAKRASRAFVPFHRCVYLELFARDVVRVLVEGLATDGRKPEIDSLRRAMRHGHRENNHRRRVRHLSFLWLVRTLRLRRTQTIHCQ